MTNPAPTPAPYTLSQPVMQAIVDVLGALPASQVRLLLNAIEAECAPQDAARCALPEGAE